MKYFVIVIVVIKYPEQKLNDFCFAKRTNVYMTIHKLVDPNLG